MMQTHSGRKILAAASGITAGVLLFFATAPYGIGIGPDAIYYLSIATNVAAGDFLFLSFVGHPLILQPPLYPAAVALGLKLSGAHAFDVARWLNILLYAGTIGFGSWLLAKHVRHAVLFVLGSVALLISLPLFTMALQALSETFFNLIVLINLAVLANYLRNKRRSNLMAMGLITAFSMLIRYPGYTLMFTGLISILLSRGSLKERVRASIIYGSISPLLLAIWLARNWKLTQTLVGPRVPSIYPLPVNIERTLHTIYGWFLPETAARQTLIITVVLLLLGGLSYYLMRNRIQSVKGILYRLVPLARVMGLFVVVYTVVQIMTSTSVALSPISSRYLSPIAAPLIIWAVLSLDAGLNALETAGKRVSTQAAAGIACAALIIYPLFQFPVLMRDVRTNGPGDYNTPAWRNSPTLNFVQEGKLTEPYPVYTNQDYIVYFWGNIDSPRSVPNKYVRDNSDTLATTVDIQRGLWPDESPAYLVWFDANTDYYFSLDELKQIADVRLIEDFSDGAIYEVRRIEP